MDHVLYEKYVYKINLLERDLEHALSSSEEVDKVREEIFEMYEGNVPFTKEQFKYLQEKEEYVNELLNKLED